MTGCFRKHKLDLVAVVVLSLGIAIAFASALWGAAGQNLVPGGDCNGFYFPMTHVMEHVKHPSDMHKSFDGLHNRPGRGKDFFVMSALLVQKMTGDRHTLRPFLLVGAASIALTAVLLFLIFMAITGRAAAWTIYFLFAFSHWPYTWVLVSAHLYLGLFFVTSAVAVMLLLEKIGSWRFFLAGMLGTTAFFSSIAAAPLAPFLIAAIIYAEREAGWPRMLMSFLWSFAGGVVCLVFFTYPDVIGNLRPILQQAENSRTQSHFNTYQPEAIQWVARPDLPVSGGWRWLVNFFMSVLPAFLTVAMVGLVTVGTELLNKRSGTERRTTAIVALVIGLMPLAGIMAKGVAQIARSYIPAFVGLLFLCGIAAGAFYRYYWPAFVGRTRMAVGACLCLLGVTYAASSAGLLFGDALPAALGSYQLERLVNALPRGQVYTYALDCAGCAPIAEYLAPVRREYHMQSVHSVSEVQDGYLVVPPVISLILGNEFEGDPVLSEIFRRGTIRQYAVASFMSGASGRFLPLEEEISAYRRLYLGQEPDADKTRFWVVDIAKVRKDLRDFHISPQVSEYLAGQQRNIGTKTALYRFGGVDGNSLAPQTLAELSFRLRKNGAPKDGLVAYVYQFNSFKGQWAPVDGFRSDVLDAARISGAREGAVVNFRFASSLKLAPGAYRVVIYRTGANSDVDFYTIFPGGEAPSQI